MNKRIYFAIITFFFVAGATVGFLSHDPKSRIPASLGDEVISENPAAIEANKELAAKAMAHIDSLYLQAITQENSLNQGAAVYDTAIQQSLVGRQQQIQQNPNQYMFPGNPYDIQYSQLVQSKAAIAADRNHNITYTNMQILLTLKQNQKILTAEQKASVWQKYMHLNQLLTVSNSQALYSWPQPNDPYLLAVQPGAMLGPQQVAMYQQPVYNPLTGLYSNQTAPILSTDIPVGGLQNTYVAPQADMINPVFDPGAVAR